MIALGSWFRNKTDRAQDEPDQADSTIEVRAHVIADAIRAGQQPPPGGQPQYHQPNHQPLPQLPVQDPAQQQVPHQVQQQPGPPPVPQPVLPPVQQAPPPMPPQVPQTAPIPAAPQQAPQQVQHQEQVEPEVTVDAEAQPIEPAGLPEQPADVVQNGDLNAELLDQALAERRTLVQLCLYAMDRARSAGVTERIEEALASVGVTALRPDGDRFDPAHHEAGGTVDTDDTELDGTVAETEVVGFSDRGTTLRVPIVTVYTVKAQTQGVAT